MKVVLAALCYISYVLALDNGIGVLPPMGWLSWQRFRCVTDCDLYPNDCISEQLYFDMADRLAEDGYRDAGYTYVNIDDCWAAKERVDNSLVGDPDRFPSGMKAMGDYLHKRGLLYGIYGDVGTLTCGGYPGSKGYEKIDAYTFASWGVDSLKLDGCYATVNDYAKRYPMWSKLLNETERHILYECSWPAYVGLSSPFKTIAKHCNYWRPYNDINDNWDDIVNIIDYWGDHQEVLAPHAGPGAFNDPDMLIIGNFALSYEESKTQMSLWAIMMAPLYMSNDLRTIDPKFREILLNKEVIAVNQDRLLVQGKRIHKDARKLLEWWTKPLSDGSVAVVIFFRSSYGNPVVTATSLELIGIKTRYATVRDLWSHSELGLHDSEIISRVNPHGVVMLKVTPVHQKDKKKHQSLSPMDEYMEISR